MIDEISQTVDWRGEPVDCVGCVHRQLLEGGKCKLGHACVADRYARRIDRFFNWNPELANNHIAHPHFEVRIRIAGQLDDADLVPMMGDSDYYVRLVVARRIAPELLGPMTTDEEAEVRRVVASRILPGLLGAMAHDPDALVRLCVVDRMPAHALAGMKDDPDWRIRHAVASRIAEPYLDALAGDADPLVAEMARMRLVSGEAVSGGQAT